ncbi:bifunctional helix-turn-helix transcriptional regulator/GNAT family N-acetyltransferase [Microlunatus speluncae]|uniref:bifunctional helix-turn-helix transcriptional regulator/GNAT family N-acetyltransferase n=1 Tax=Microlunatus speluncae TaxID=2594267 RepID=UPI001266518D|nr:helix-turn-helix domain-containing GNAT family N-acetyltransferase [Microlunatus speluncae]
MSKVDSVVVDRIRSFNRFYTKIIGVLDEGLVGSPYNLTEARVLYELATTTDGLDIADLRTRLGLDPGYTTRILDRFTESGLVTRQRSEQDRRRQTITLTGAGRTVQTALNRRTERGITRLLEPLTGSDRARLVTAMGTVRALLGRGPERRVELRAAQPGDLGWIVERNAMLYADEYGWDATYEALVAKIVADFAQDHDPARERVWIAEVDGERAGAVFCVRGDDADTAKLRLLLTEPWARGLGLGTRLVDACIAFARAAGYSRLVLWTNDILAAARRIYQRAGFVLIDEESHHSFGTDLTGQTWQLDL